MAAGLGGLGRRQVHWGKQAHHPARQWRVVAVTTGDAEVVRVVDLDQVRVLENANYAATGAFVGFDVKAQRTQKAESATAHLATSKAVFLALVEKSRTFPQRVAEECIAARDYEALERTVLEHLLGC